MPGLLAAAPAAAAAAATPVAAVAAGGAGTSPGLTVDDLGPLLLLVSLVLLAGIGSVRLASRSGLPTLLLYLALGMALASPPLEVQLESLDITQVIGYGALVVILAEGGLTTSWQEIRPAVLPAAVLSTLGVVVSVLVVGVATHLLLDLPWTIAFLLGAILSSTDAAAVFSVLRKVPLPTRLTGMLEAESGLNDAPVVILVVSLADIAAGTRSGDGAALLGLAGLAAFELAVGAALGLGLGLLGGAWLRRVASASSALFSLGVLAVPVLAYAVGALLHASGFLATYVAALTLGNMALPHRPAVRSFAQSSGWMAQIALFVMLGLLATPERLAEQLVPAVVAGAVLLLLARPLSVVVSMTPFGIPWREQAFLSWAGLRGAVPIVLATVPLTHGTRGMGWVVDLVFVLVVLLTLVQAPTLPVVARRLGVGATHQVLDVEVEATPLEAIGAHVLQVDIGPTSRLQGVEVFELRLPQDTNVALVVRASHTFVPGPTTALRQGDRLLVVTTRAARAQTEAILRRVSEEGRLAGWHRDARRRLDRTSGGPAGWRDGQVIGG